MRNPTAPPPGTPMGPMGLPVSYSWPDMIRLKLVEGRYNNSQLCWELKKGGKWVRVPGDGKSFTKDAYHHQPRFRPRQVRQVPTYSGD